MTPREIVTLSDFTSFFPKIVSLHKELDGLWEPELTTDQFRDVLLEKFNSERHYFYGDFTPTGEVAYFAVLSDMGDDKILFWLFYMNKDFREVTKEIVNQLKVIFKDKGFNCAYSQSTRAESSYRRWIEKFGAQQLAIVYRIPL